MGGGWGVGEGEQKKQNTEDSINTQRMFSFCPLKMDAILLKKGEESRGRVSYSAHVKALSNAWREPPAKGFGGFGSLAIHHPTGILTAFNPLFAMNLKSSSTI